MFDESNQNLTSEAKNLFSIIKHANPTWRDDRDRVISSLLKEKNNENILQLCDSDLDKTYLLDYVVLAGHASAAVVRKLLDQGAEPNRRIAIHTNSFFLEVVKKEQLDVVREFCTHEKVDRLDQIGEAINVAARLNNIPLAKVLLQYIKRKNIRWGSLNGVTDCLHNALWHANEEMTRLLLDNGANPNSKNEFGIYPLEFAIGRLKDWDLIDNLTPVHVKEKQNPGDEYLRSLIKNSDIDSVIAAWHAFSKKNPNVIDGTHNNLLIKVTKCHLLRLIAAGCKPKDENKLIQFLSTQRGYFVAPTTDSMRLYRSIALPETKEKLNTKLQTAVVELKKYSSVARKSPDHFFDQMQASTTHEVTAEHVEVYAEVMAREVEVPAVTTSSLSEQVANIIACVDAASLMKEMNSLIENADKDILKKLIKVRALYLRLEGVELDAGLISFLKTNRNADFWRTTTSEKILKLINNGEESKARPWLQAEIQEIQRKFTSKGVDCAAWNAEHFKFTAPVLSSPIYSERPDRAVYASPMVSVEPPVVIAKKPGLFTAARDMFKGLLPAPTDKVGPSVAALLASCPAAPTHRVDRQDIRAATVSKI